MPHRLAGSASPYLRQHADDPVEWYVWGDEPFEAAARLGRPVLLSCGYSACHWCHVMQRESFRDAGTAALINERFVAVKVDRELRPDVDALYQDYVAASTGSGGWPLTVWLTPERLPVFGGTYFPKDAPPGLVSFPDALSAVADAWRDDRADVERTAAESLSFLRAQAAKRPEGPIDRAMLDFAADQVVQMQDTVHGGLAGAPKFPQFPVVEFLCAYAALVPDVELLLAIERTLLAVVRGGVFDQVGGGMHRYATDEAWRVPHFEKMLYDQGLLLSSLAAAAPLASGEDVRDEYAHAALATTAFLRREMALPGGGFAGALSADTGGVEGATYTWTRDQLVAVLDDSEMGLAVERLGAEPSGSTRAVTLHRPDGRGDDADAVDAVLAKLAAARAARPQPERDGKLLTSWNAMAARGLMDAGRAFGDRSMVETGMATLDVLLSCAVRADGVVRESSDPAVADVRLLEDAAHLVSALLTAADATDDPTFLGRAADLHADAVERFGDGSILYLTPLDTDLPVRAREGGDSAVPTGASTTIENAVRLGTATADAAQFAFARAALSQMWSLADFAPEQAGRTLSAAVLLEMAGRG